MQHLGEFLDKQNVTLTKNKQTNLCTCEALGYVSRSPKAPSYLALLGKKNSTPSSTEIEKLESLIYWVDHPNPTR